MYSKADQLAGIVQPKEVRPVPRRLLDHSGVAQHIHYRGTKSGYKGVIFQEHAKNKPWKAYLRHHGQHITIGYFPSKELAALAYNRYAKKIHKSQACLNTVCANTPSSSLASRHTKDVTSPTRRA